MALKKKYSKKSREKADRYYASILVEEDIEISNKPYSEGMGVDLGQNLFQKLMRIKLK